MVVLDHSIANRANEKFKSNFIKNKLVSVNFQNGYNLVQFVIL